jgi:hypothetical protein
MKKCFLAILFLLSVNKLFSQCYVDTILSKYPLKDKEILAIVFIENGSCSKCVISPELVLDSAFKKTGINFVIVAYVGCNRAKEIYSFKRNYDWKYFIEPDIKRKTRKLLGCEAFTELCLINSNGEIIAECSVYDSYQKMLGIILSALDKLE